MGELDGGDSPDTGRTANGTSSALLVYSANVENLPTTKDACPGDWKDLYSYIAVSGRKPDLLLVQQISDQGQLDQLVAHMSTTFGRSYASVIAEANPAPYTSPCGAAKDKQTNAIIYDTGRLVAVGGKHVWKTFKMKDGQCIRNDVPRARGVLQKFADKVVGTDVAVASIHWSIANGSGPDPACALRNVEELDQLLRMAAFQAPLQIFGGDTNEDDLLSPSKSSGYRPWYAAANGDLGGKLGFRDAIYAHCATKADVKGCLLNNWTFGSTKRIDFIFARGGDGSLPQTSDARTVTFAEANAADQQLTGADAAQGYSDHRAVSARIHPTQPAAGPGCTAPATISDGFFTVGGVDYYANTAGAFCRCPDDIPTSQTYCGLPTAATNDGVCKVACGAPPPPSCTPPASVGGFFTVGGVDYFGNGAGAFCRCPDDIPTSQSFCGLPTALTDDGVCGNACGGPSCTPPATVNGFFTVAGADYFGNGAGAFCRCPDDIATSQSFCGLPTALADHGMCGNACGGGCAPPATVSEGLFSVGATDYYSNGAEFCRCPNDVPTSRSYCGPPAGMTDKGACGNNC